MKFPLSWLARYLCTSADAGSLADAMTRLGIEVESLTNAADALAPFRIARVLSAEPHPAADRLRLLSVDTGDGPPVSVVCGAPNARAGMLGVFGPPGARVPGLDLVLKVSEIRGVASYGMMCSARELELGDDHEGILDLPADAPVGEVYARWAGLDDPVFDVAITPDRADCMGVFGIARDLAAAGLGVLTAPEVPTLPDTPPCAVEIAIEDEAGCPAFLARSVHGVANGPSPAWLQALLVKAGLRPVSALVDITNYFAIGFGRPLHVYDIARLDGGLVARSAREGERIEALNGRTYALAPGMTVIADTGGVVHDIGGIMGGAHAGVSEATTDVLIEAALFDPAGIGRTGRALNIMSDARQRFERGVDPAFVAPALDLAAAMVRDLCGGRISGMAQAGAIPKWERTIIFGPERTLALGGIAVPPARQIAILERLGFSVAGAGPWRVAVPSWRRDVEGPADLVEEIVRLEGIETVSCVPLPRVAGVARPQATRAQRLERRLRRTMAARGLDEAINWSFIPADAAERFGGSAWHLENPLSAELAQMRPSLLPGLLAAAERNRARGAERIALFEIGRRYLAEGERATLGILLAGEARAADWREGRARSVNAFDAKGHAIAALAAAGVPVDRLQTAMPAAAHYHPGRSARLMLGKAVLAEFGMLHPALLDGMDAAAAEIFLDALPETRSGRRDVFDPSPFQPVRRDFAFLVPDAVPAEALLKAVRGADRDLVRDVRLFDRFAGAGVPQGQLSLGVRVTLSPRHATLTEADIEAASVRIVAAAASLGATLRG